MGYTRRKNRSKRKLGKKGRSKKRRIYKRQNYKKQRYLRGGVGTPQGTPVAGNSPINMNFITPPIGNNFNNVSPIGLGANLNVDFEDAAAQQALIENTDTLNSNGSPTSVAHSNFRKKINP